MNAERFTKLPVWAQDHIKTLQRERDTAVEELRRFEHDQKPSRIWVEDHACLGEESGPSSVKRYIDAHAVSFALGDNEIELRYDLREKKDRLTLRCGFNRLMLLPEVTNSVEIRVAD